MYVYTSNPPNGLDEYNIINSLANLLITKFDYGNIKGNATLRKILKCLEHVCVWLLENLLFTLHILSGIHTSNTERFYYADWISIQQNMFLCNLVQLIELMQIWLHVVRGVAEGKHIERRVLFCGF